jgi:hypothetical protein
MGNIGPSQKRFDVLPVPALGLENADRWTVPARITVPSPGPMPVPHPEPTPTPDPGPVPSVEDRQ